MLRLRVCSLGVVLALGLFAGCGSSGSSGGKSGGQSSKSSSTPAKTTGGGSSQGSGSSSSSGTKVTIADFKYKPATITVKVGQKVTWTNTDSSNHTATAKQGSFDTGNLQKGNSKAVTFSKPGTFTYTCSYHPFMHGTVVVR